MNSTQSNPTTPTLPPRASATDTEQKEVAISYAYPTSPNASKLGYSKLGCYVVELVTHRLKRIGRPLGFATKREAMEFADSLGLPFNRYSQPR